MPYDIDQAYIFVPMLAIVLLTFITFIRMGAARGAAMKEMDPSYYRAHQGGQEPESAAAAVRHYGNLFEAPTLFYAACITAFVLGAVGQWTVWFAWGYVILRVIQSLVHGTYNNPAHRGVAFILSMLFMAALWVNVGMSVFARI